jgi:hypothetical protein
VGTDSIDATALGAAGRRRARSGRPSDAGKTGARPGSAFLRAAAVAVLTLLCLGGATLSASAQYFTDQGSVSPTSYTYAGTVLTFSFAYNTGGQQYVSTQVTSSQMGLTYSCVSNPANPGNSTGVDVTCSAPYVVKSSDLYSGALGEIATVFYTNQNGGGNEIGQTNFVSPTFVPPPYPTVTVSSSPNISNAGQSVTLTATVSATGGHGTPTGTVTFVEDWNYTTLGTATLDGTGHASITTTEFVPGEVSSFEADYSGDSVYGATSGADTVDQTVHPAVTAISPSTGPTAGGTAVTITGVGFTDATGVTIGGAAATNFHVVSDTSITATTPAGSAGTASVLVSTPGGANPANTLYTYSGGAVTATQSVASKALTQNQPSASFTPVTGGGGATPLSYSISPSLPTGLSLSTSTGAITGTPSATLATATFTVTVTDANSQTASNTFQLTVNSAVTATQSIASETLTQSRATSFTPVTGGGGTTPLSYSISPGLPTGMSISSSTGAISGTPSATLAATSFTVTVTDTNGATASNSFTLTVNSAVTATQAIPTETLTQNHATTGFTPVTGGGGTGSLSYTVSPTLPTGLSISSSTGAISGTPTATAVATTYTVTVTDINGATASNTFVLIVNSAVTATQSISSAILTQNFAVTSFTPITSGGGTAPRTYGVSPTLPAGLTLSSTSGAITGTPTATLAATPFTVTVTDANGATASNTFSLTVNGAVTATQAIASKTLTQNHAATSFTPITGGGGVGTLAYSISPTLPTGLSFDTSTGAVTGTPTATLGATTFTVTVTDANSATASNTFSLTINSAVTATQAVASATLTANAAATSFTPVTGGGGAPPLSYAVSPTLPAGLSMASGSGAITGTPTALSAATTYTVTVTDANGGAATNTFALTVNAPALTTTQAVASANVVANSPITPFIPVTASGGFGTVTFALSGATLPNGLSFSTTTGQISGTPTALLAATTFTVTATDQTTPTAQTSSQTFSLTVTAPALTTTQAIASTTLTAETPATPFIPVTASGGFGAISFALSGATLPSGLSFNTSNGQITGTPTVAAAATVFTVTATDSATPTRQTSSKTFSLTVNKAAPGVVVTSSPPTALYGTPVTFTATLSGGASPTGTVTFKVDGTPIGTSPLNGATATFTTKTIAAGAHTISAVYNGDANNAVATNATALTVTSRPNPADDPDVRGLVAAQVNAAGQFAHAQIGNTVRRLEQMHDEDEDGDAAGPVAAAPVTIGKAGVGAAAASPYGALAAFSADAPAGSTGAAAPAAASATVGSAPYGGLALGADPFGANQPLGYADAPYGAAKAPQSQAGLAIESAAAMLPSAFEALDKTGVLPFHVWAAGALTFGMLNANGGYDDRFDSAGVTVGFDGKIAPDLKAGVALGFGFDHATVGSDGTTSDARAFTAALYSSWRVAPHSFIDLIGGYGTLRFNSQRWSSTGDVMLSGVRSGGEVFGSLGFTQDANWAGLKISAYGRLDAARILLDAYQETGSGVWALSYGSLQTTMLSSVVGSRIGYPIAESWGVLTPSARFEYAHEFAGAYAQSLNYADLAGSPGYMLNGVADWRDTLTGGLGLRAETHDQLSLDFEYLISGTPSQLQAQEFRLAAKQAF